MIREGQRLNIWIKGNPTTTASRVASVKPVTSTDLQGRKTYTVQPGDTLWDISRKFNGLTIERIKSLNKLTNSKIQPGQKLIVGI